MIPSSFDAKIVGPVCTAADIKAFEEFANTTLPGAYAAFLLKFNGCVPTTSNDTYHGDVELPGGNEITVQQFFSLSNTCPPLRSLYQELKADVDFMPVTSIPIGVDSFGNVIGLDCETGLVNWTLCEKRFWLDYLRNFDLGISFDLFIASLKPGPYDERE